MDEILKYFPNLSELQKQQLHRYVDRLLWWNAQINLISRQDTEHIMQRHILHSLAIARCMQFPSDSRILDLGTGGGLPGIPLAIYFPKCTFTLIDGTGKKIKAVQAIIEDLGLQNVTAFHARAEEFRGDFDFVVSRAVASLKELWGWAGGRIKIQAKAVSFAGLRRPKEAEVKDIEDATFGEGGATWSRGMIVLKGGDLKLEITEMGKSLKGDDIRKKVQVVAIHDLFPEPYFLEKFIVFIPATPAPGSPG